MGRYVRVVAVYPGGRKWGERKGPPAGHLVKRGTHPDITLAIHQEAMKCAGVTPNDLTEFQAASSVGSEVRRLLGD